MVITFIIMNVGGAEKEGWGCGKRVGDDFIIGGKLYNRTYRKMNDRAKNIHQDVAVQEILCYVNYVILDIG